jgi:arylsulfatase
MLPTLLAVAGEPDVVEKAKKGMKLGDKTIKVHSTATTCCPTWSARSPRTRGPASCTGATTAN